MTQPEITVCWHYVVPSRTFRFGSSGQPRLPQHDYDVSLVKSDCESRWGISMGYSASELLTEEGREEIKKRFVMMLEAYQITPAMPVVSSNLPADAQALFEAAREEACVAARL